MNHKPCVLGRAQIYRERPVPVQLNYRRAAGSAEMGHPPGCIEEIARLIFADRRSIRRPTHSQPEDAGEHGDMLAHRMPVWGKLIAGGHFTPALNRLRNLQNY